MAQAFSPQRVLATEERSGFYGRGSLYALRGKEQAGRAQHRLYAEDSKQIAARC